MKKTISALLLVSSLLFQETVLLSAWGGEPDYLRAGICEYYKGHYASAKVHLQTAIRKHPKDQKAHYFLAQSLSELHDNKAAVEAYKKCHLLDPGSECGIKAKDGLKSHNAFEYRKLEQNYKAINQNRIYNTKDRIATQVEREISASDEANKKLAQKKLEEAQQEAERIQKQAQQDINSLPRLRRNGWWRAQMRQEIQEQSKQRAQEVMKRAKAQAEQLDKDLTRRKESLQDLHDGLHSSLGNPKAKGTSIRPEGTNIYVRNYEHR